MRMYKEIFIFVAGATTQIITETIYSLAKKTPPVKPDEIIAITTSEGKKKAEETLINQGILKKLFEELKIPEKELKFVVAKDSSGTELEDIRTEADNEAIGNLITSLIKEKSEDKTTRLHCSLAGGRKTMSFYLGAALQLLGRPQDKLYHVLVTPEFESLKDFYYPPLKPKTIYSNGRKLNTKHAQISLAELPFVRLGGKVAIEGKTYTELTRESQKEIDAAVFISPVTVNLKKRTITIGNAVINLPPIQLAIYTMFLDRKLRGCKKKDCGGCTDCYVPLKGIPSDALDKIEEIYQKLRMKPENRKDLSDDHIMRGHISKIKKAIYKALDNEILAQYYSIDKSGKYGSTCYGIKIDKSRITVQ